MSRMILAQKKSRPVNAIYVLPGFENANQIVEFCHGSAKIEDGEFKCVSLENSRKIVEGDFIIQGAAGEFYASGNDQFKKNYIMDEFDESNPDSDPKTFWTVPKFVHAFQFTESTFNDACVFINSQKLDGVRLYKADDKFYISHPTREDYEIKDGEMIVCDFRRLYPCVLDIFNDTYDLLATELEDNYVLDSSTIFTSTDDPDFYYIETAAHSVNPIFMSTDASNDIGIGLKSILRVARDMTKRMNKDDNNDLLACILLNIENALDCCYDPKG